MKALQPSPTTPPGQVLAVTTGASPQVRTNASTPMHGSFPAPGSSGHDKSHVFDPRANSLGVAAQRTEDEDVVAFAAAARRADRSLASRRIAWPASAAHGRVQPRASLYARATGGGVNPMFRRDLDALRDRFSADAAPERTLAWLEETERDPARRHALLQDLQRLVQPEGPSADPGNLADALATAVKAHRARFRPQIDLAEDVGRALTHCTDTNPAKSKALRDAYFEAVRGLDENTVLHPLTLIYAMRGTLSKLAQQDLKTAVDELNRAMLAVHGNAHSTRFPGRGPNLALGGSSLVVHLQTALALCEEGVRRLTASGIRLAQDAGNTAAKKILAMTISPTNSTSMQALVESLAGSDPKAGLALTQEILAVIRRLDDAIWPSPAARDGVVWTVLQWCDRMQAEPAAAPPAAPGRPLRR